MIDFNKIFTLLFNKDKTKDKFFHTEHPKFNLPNYTVSSVYEKEKIEKIIVRPNNLVSKEKNLIVDNVFKRYYFVTRLPDGMNPGTFAEILSLDEVDVEFSYKLIPKNTFEKTEEIRHNLNILSGQLRELNPDDYMTDAINEILTFQKNTLRNLDNGIEMAYTERIYLIVKAHSQDDLEYSCSYLEKYLQSKNIQIKCLEKLQIDAFVDSSPLGTTNFIIPGREIVSEDLTKRYMLVKPQIVVDPHSMIWGYDNNNLPLYFNQWEECAAYHWILTGMTGQGKSVLAKYLFLNQIIMMLDEKGKVNGGYVIIDPNQEYKDICRLTGGVYIELGGRSNIRLNILDCLDLSRAEKISQLEFVFPLLFEGENSGRLPAPQWDALRRALVTCYNNKGITPDYSLANGYKPQPTLNDLYLQLEKDAVIFGKGVQRSSYDAVKTRLTKFIKIHTADVHEEGQFAFMSEETKNLDLNSLDKMAFSIQGVERSVQSAYMFLIIDTIWRQMIKNREKNALEGNDKASRFIFLMDEVHMLIDNPFVKRSLDKMAAIARKYHVSMGFITQRISTYKDSDDDGSSILANTHVKIFLAQDETEADKIGKMYHLEPNVVERMQTLTVGQYFVMVKAKKYKFHRFLNNTIPNRLLELFETNAQRVLENNRKRIKDKYRIAIAFDELAKAGMASFFRDNNAFSKYKDLKKRKKELNDQDLAKLKDYEKHYWRIGFEQLPPSDAVSYEYMLYLEKNQVYVKEEIQDKSIKEKEHLSKSEVLADPKMYYFIEQLSSDIVDALSKLGFITVTYKTSKTTTLTYLTQIKTHVKHRPITQIEANYYSSSKNMAKLDSATKQAIDHHMMQVHIHSILKNYVHNVKEIKMWDTAEVDIAFPGPDKTQYAIEAESGSAMKETEHLRTKINRNNDKYGKNWVFYVPSQTIKRVYVQALLELSKDPITHEEAESKILLRTDVFDYVLDIFDPVKEEEEKKDEK